MQVFVLGMHRSGTSTVARILNMMGFYFGPEGIALEPASDNMKGFWERRDVKEINDNLLRANGASWSHLANFNLEDLTEESKSQFFKNARSVINGIDANRPWMIKDPRNCITFALWKQLLELPICVHVLRNPYEIALSLNKRNNFPIFFSLALWERYQVDALKASENVSNLIVSYNNLMINSLGTVRKLYDELVQQGVTGIRMPSEHEINSFINEDLCHHEGTESDLEKFLNPNQSGLWKSLQKDSLRKNDYEKYFKLDYSLLSTYETFFEREKEVEILSNQSKQKDDAINALKKTVLSQEKTIADLKRDKESAINHLKKEQEVTIADLKRDKESAISHLKKEQEKTIADLKRDKESAISHLKKEQEITIANLKREQDATINKIRKEQEETIEHFTQKIEVKKSIDQINTKFLGYEQESFNKIERLEDGISEKIERYGQKLLNESSNLSDYFNKEALRLNAILEQIIKRHEIHVEKLQFIQAENINLQNKQENVYSKISEIKDALQFHNNEVESWQFELKNTLNRISLQLEKEINSVEYSTELHQLNLNSWRWKIGNFLVRNTERLLLREKNKLAVDHLTILLGKSVKNLSLLNRELYRLKQLIEQKDLYAGFVAKMESLTNEGNLIFEAHKLPLKTPQNNNLDYSGIKVDVKSINKSLFFSDKSKLKGKLTITIISPTTNIHGGTKRLLMIAKLLHKRGHKINFIRQYQSRGLDWFDLGVPVIDLNFSENTSPEELEQKIPDGDVLITYGNNKANKVLDKLTALKGKKFQLFMHFGIHDKDLDIQNAGLSNFQNLCTTTWIKDQLLDYTNDRPHLIDFGVHNDQFFPTRSERPLRIGALYHKSEWKRTKDVLLAYKEVVSNSDFQNLKIVMYGQDPNPDLMGIKCEYFFDPSQDQIRDIYSSCAIWITPSLFEGIGMCSVEAMLCKTPLITVDTGGSRDFCNSANSLIVEKESPKAIAEGIIKLLRNPVQASKMAEIAYTSICEHTWSNSIDLLEIGLKRKGGASLSLSGTEKKVERDSYTLTIGIPIHNQLDYVMNCVNSILENTSNDFQILLVDDNSNEETHQYLSSIVSENIAYIRNNEQKGFPYNCNTILRFAKGDFICLLNSDTIVTKDWDKYLIDALKEDDRLGMVGPSTSYGVAKNYDQVAQQLDEVHFKRFEMNIKEIQDFSKELRRREGDNSLSVEYLNGFCMMLKAEIVADVGFFDTDFGLGSREEVQYIDRMREEGYHVNWVKGAYVHHYGHRSFSSIEDSKALWEKNKKLYYKTKGQKRQIGITRKKIGFVFNAKNSSSTRKRTFEPMSILQRFLNVDAIHYRELDESFFLNHEIIVLQRIGGLNEVINPVIRNQLFRWIEKYKAQNRIFIYDLDDLIIHAQDDLPLKLIKQCHFVSLSTEVLSDHIKQFNSNTVVLPNGVDYLAYKKATSKVMEKNVIRVVCFSLAGAGAQEFNTLAELVKKKTNSKIEFHLFSGERLNGDELNYIQIHKNVPLEEYFGWLKIADYSVNWDKHSSGYFEKLKMQYGLKKGEEDTFINGKSGLKYYNSAISKTVFITTPQPTEYSRLVQDRVNGFVVTEPEQAAEIILELNENPFAKNKILKNAYEEVFSNFTLENTAQFYLDFFSKL